MKYDEIWDTEERGPVVVSYGGGVNSTAMLIGMVERGQRPDAILFANTAAEFPETYKYVDGFSGWLTQRGFPEITHVAYNSKHETLEQECHNNNTLPSLAFGFRGCSHKWKRYPMEKWVKAWQPAIEAHERGHVVYRLLGIDAGEQHRGRIDGEREKCEYHRPLVEWCWNRRQCIQVIEDSHLCVPKKSACFFCPATRKAEVKELYRDEPELFARAVAMEQHARDNGGLKSIQGLGRHWSWEQVAAADAKQLRLLPDVPQIPCECFDGVD